MTQKKLEIIGPYTPEHEGPYVLKTSNLEEQCIVHAVVEGTGFITICGRSGPGLCAAEDLMNAREVPVVREFWLNEFKRGDGCVVISYAHHTELQAINERHELENWNWARTIHVREVLPGEGE